MESKGDQHQGDSTPKPAEGLQYQDDGLHVAHESGLEVVHPGTGAFHSVSNLPEVSQAPSEVWQQAEKTNSWYQHNQQNSPYQTAQAPGYAAVPTISGNEQIMHPVLCGVRPKLICGIRKKICIIILAVVILVVVLGIAVGLGVGLGLRKSSNSDSDSDSGNSDDGPIPSTLNANITCPGADNTTYQADGTSRFFQVICGVDYNGQDGAVDLTSQNETSMAACIDECASRDDCTAAGWGNYFNNKVCFLKKSIGSSHEADGWTFTREVDDPNAGDSS
ncbi:Fc.00g112220.m01.CDS01 [Cosmosporella sp. VM-42]